MSFSHLNSLIFVLELPTHLPLTALGLFCWKEHFNNGLFSMQLFAEDHTSLYSTVSPWIGTWFGPYGTQLYSLSPTNRSQLDRHTHASIGASAVLIMHYFSCLLGQTDYIPHVSFVGSFIITATRISVTCMVSVLYLHWKEGFAVVCWFYTTDFWRWRQNIHLKYVNIYPHPHSL
jgi:hypothetical protein